MRDWYGHFFGDCKKMANVSVSIRNEFFFGFKVKPFCLFLILCLCTTSAFCSIAAHEDSLPIFHRKGLKITALDKYMEKKDSHYSWHDTGHKIKGRVPSGTFEGTVLNFTSQGWLTNADVSCSVWTHNMVILTPQVVEFSSTGFLLIGGGDNDGLLPSSTDELLLIAAQVAVETRSSAAVVYQIPNQPCVFMEDSTQAKRTEDDIIAYTWRHFIDDVRRDEWPLRLPMTKAAARALDTWQAYNAYTSSSSVQQFVVSGASKRGWTAWTLAAVDKRVVGLVPMVMDALNLRANLHHFYQALGGWSFAFGPYYELNLTSLVDSKEMATLIDIIDPFVYVNRLKMPKLIIVASNDEFFMLDDSEYYWNKLMGEKHLLILANVEHSLVTGLPKLLIAVEAFYLSILKEKERREEAQSNTLKEEKLREEAQNNTTYSYRSRETNLLEKGTEGKDRRASRILSKKASALGDKEKEILSEEILSKERLTIPSKARINVGPFKFLRGNPSIFERRKQELNGSIGFTVKEETVSYFRNTRGREIEWGKLVMEALGSKTVLVDSIEEISEFLEDSILEPDFNITSTKAALLDLKKTYERGSEGEKSGYLEDKELEEDKNVNFKELSRCPSGDGIFPRIKWKKDRKGGVLEVFTSHKPILTVLWVGHTSKDTLRRDFRWIRANDGHCTTRVVGEGIGCLQPTFFLPHIIKPKYMSSTGARHYIAEVEPPMDGYTAFFIEVRFKGPKANMPFISTTEAVIVPDIFPFPDCQGENCKGDLV